MRRSTLLAFVLASSSCFAQTQSAEPSSFLAALQNMPAQIRAGTFDQEAFNASQAQAEADANFDVPAACRLLEADLADSNVKVNSLAFVSLANLMRRKSNTDGDRQILASTLLSGVDKCKESSQPVCGVRDRPVPRYRSAEDRRWHCISRAGGWAKPCGDEVA
jgi:hypothetical protein